MTNSEAPNLSLGEPPKRLAKRTNSAARGWLVLIVVLQLVVCGLAVVRWGIPGGSNDSSRVAPVSAEKLRAAAIQLEEKSLNAEAARTWEEYLNAAATVPDRAPILYRIGALYLKAEAYGRAASAFVLAEQFAAEEDGIKDKVGPKVVDCLRHLGLYGEVGRELSRRVQVGGDDDENGKRVIATFAGEALTDADLDRMIERRVDQMLDMQGLSGNSDRRDAVLKQFSSPAMRQQLLHELLQTELFSRRARDLKLDREDAYLKARQSLEESLLADRFLRKELATIQPTDVDIEAYYQANKKSYEIPDTLSVVLIPLDPEEDEAAVLKQIHSADDFRKIAKDRKGSKDSDELKPATETIVRGRHHPLLGAADALFEMSPGEWTKTAYQNGKKKFLVLVEQKTPATTPPLTQIRNRVETDYRSRKQQEVMEKLFRDLMTRYDVRIMAREKKTESATLEPTNPAQGPKASQPARSGGTSKP